MTREVGMDFKNMKATKVRLAGLYLTYGLFSPFIQVGVFTDPNIAKLQPMKTVCPRRAVSMVMLRLPQYFEGARVPLVTVGSPL